MQLDHQLDHESCYRAVTARDARFDGQFFTGVRTTGIYCRPVCPARTPLAANVDFYLSAAAAQEAGLRPCLRCRPEAAPDLAAWRGTSNSVARALALIETGALDENDVEALAERLGMGARQLRRLFRQHLGAPPVAVAQTRRVLLAKQLLHETSLPIAQVALAAGFGSIRRFNETFHSLYNRPPSALRHGTAQTQGDSITLRLPYRPPYDWPAIIGFLRTRAIPGVEHVEPNLYARSIAFGTDHGLIAIRPSKGDFLTAEIHFPHLPTLPAIIARIRRVFDLAADPHAISEALSQDAKLAPLLAARPGLRVPGAWDGFELGVRAILGQQISVAGATTLATRIVAAHGEALPPGLHNKIPSITHIFPSPAALALADLSGLGLVRARAAAISSLAAALQADRLLLTPRGALDDAVARLRALPGIGEWTAQYIAMRALREADAFPHGDIGLLRAMAENGTRPSAAALLVRAEAWRPWRAYAALHLWTSETTPETHQETQND